MSIDHEGDVPIYVQLAAILRGEIESGGIPPRRPVPSKRTLRERHGVSAGTVERAMDVLKGEGLIRTVMGRGLYVVPPEERGR